MCDIRYAKDRIDTWVLLAELHSIDTSAAIKRLKQLERRHKRLIDDYKQVYEGLREDYYDRKGVPVDSRPGSD